MALTVDEIKSLFTSYIDPNQRDDPDAKYDTNGDGNDDNIRPDVSPGEWEAIWHYLDKAIVNKINPEFRDRFEVTAVTTDSTTQSVGMGNTVPVIWDGSIQQDSPYTLNERSITVGRTGTYEISAMAVGSSDGGSVFVNAFPQVYDGTSWFQPSGIQTHETVIETGERMGLEIPTFTYELNESDRVRLMLYPYDGTASAFVVENGWLSLRLVQ